MTTLADTQDETERLQADACRRARTLWHLYKPVGTLGSRYYLEREHPHHTAGLPGMCNTESYRTWFAQIGLPNPETRDASRPDIVGVFIVALRYELAPSATPLGAVFVGPSILPAARGRHLAHRLYHEAIIVAEQHRQTRITRNTGLGEGGWWLDHLYWQKIRRGILSLPPGWQYIPGPSDHLVELTGSDDDPDWPASELTAEELNRFGHLTSEGVTHA